MMHAQAGKMRKSTPPEKKVTSAVITGTQHTLTTRKRQATKNSGQITGLEVLRIINEADSSNSKLTVSPRRKPSSSWYSTLRGGTFDVSIIETRSDLFEVKSANGGTHLGGDDHFADELEWLNAGNSKKPKRHQPAQRQSSAPGAEAEAAEAQRSNFHPVTESDYFNCRSSQR